MARFQTYTPRHARLKVLETGEPYTMGTLAARPGAISTMRVSIRGGQHDLELNAAEAVKIGTQLLSMGQDDALVQAGGTRERRGVDNPASYPTLPALHRLLDALVDVMLEHGDPKTPAEIELHAAYRGINRGD